MLGTVFFVTALLSTVLPIYGASLRDQRLDAIVRLLESKVANAKSSSSSEGTSGGDDAHSFVEHKMRAMDVINLIQQANKNKQTAQNYKNRQRLQNKSNRLNQFYEYDFNRNDKDSDGIKNQIMEQLLKEERKPLKVENQRLTPNRLLSPNQYTFQDGDRVPDGGLNEYSKIFVILDPTALQKSRNTENLSSLLSRILTQSSSAVENSRQERSKVQSYKGFAVKDKSSKSRRFRRESNEKYGGNGGGGGDMDDDYRPKRPRNDHGGGGGGGGGGGRTAIPYIRHRGDIYEKDH